MRSSRIVKYGGLEEKAWISLTLLAVVMANRKANLKVRESNLLSAQTEDQREPIIPPWDLNLVLRTTDWAEFSSMPG